MLIIALQKSGIRALLAEGGARRHWPVIAMFGLLAIFALFFLMNGRGVAFPEAVKLAKAEQQLIKKAELLPKPEPQAIRDLSPVDAVAYNAAIPISATLNPAALPFRLRTASETDRLRAIECLTAAIYYEAATEPLDGQRAVAQVVLNRVRHPAFPKSVCGVVFEGSERTIGCQFTFTCDGSMARAPHPVLWQRAKSVAEAALSGKVFAPVGWATHYHTNWVAPYWSSSLVKSALVGTHIFYRWQGGWGQRPAFRFSHAGSEPTVAKMARIGDPTLQTTKTELAAAVGGTGEAIPAALADRPVVRRYEPVAARVSEILAAQAEAAGQAQSSSHSWALTGTTSVAVQPLGKAAERDKALKGEQSIELTGVRKVGDQSPVLN